LAGGYALLCVLANPMLPCVKTKWVEYFGEHPDPVIDRVE
jgi:hypothetical protein